MSVRKILPVNPYDVPKMQYYLREQANQGLFIERVGNLAKFDKALPKDVIYRIDPLGDKHSMPTSEKRELYTKYGWDYVCSVHGRYAIYRTEEKPITEIFTDQESAEYALKSLEKSIRLSAVFSAFYLIFMFAITWMTNRSSDGTLLVQNLQDHSLKLILLLVPLIMMVRELNNFWGIHQFKMHLEYVSTMIKEQPYKRNYYSRFYFYFRIFMTIVAIVLLINIQVFSHSTSRGELDDAQQFLTLNDIHSVEEKHLNANDKVFIQSTLFASRMTEIYEKNQLSSLMLTNYHIRFSFLGNRLVEDLAKQQLDKEIRLEDMVTLENIRNDVHSFDNLVILSSGEWRFIIIRQADEITTFEYTGDATTKKLIESISDKY